MTINLEIWELTNIFKDEDVLYVKKQKCTALSGCVFLYTDDINSPPILSSQA